MIKFKAFIYRFSNIFGLRIYLAKKEEKEFMRQIRFYCLVAKLVGVGDSYSEFYAKSSLGLWHAKHGFTTIYTGKQSFIRSLVSKVKHAFSA